jgi:hypothetical protein
MRVDRHLRKRLSIGLIGVMLLMQWLVLAHACDRALPGPVGVAAHAGCAAHDAQPEVQAAAASLQDNPALCKAHCTEEPGVPAAQADGPLPAASLGWFIVTEPAPVSWMPAPAAHRLPPVGAAPPGWPPLYLSQQVLRN